MGICRRLGVKPALLVFSVLAFVLPFLLFGLGGSALSNLIAALFPAHSTYKVLEKLQGHALAKTVPEPALIGDATFYLQYWVVFAVIQNLEGLFEFFLFWLPMYRLLKIAGAIWLYHPTLRGAAVVYTSFVAPSIRKVQPQVDTLSDHLGSILGDKLRGFAMVSGSSTEGSSKSG